VETASYCNGLEVERISRYRRNPSIDQPLTMHGIVVVSRVDIERTCPNGASTSEPSSNECEFRLEQGMADPGLAANGFQGRRRYIDVGCDDFVSILP